MNRISRWSRRECARREADLVLFHYGELEGAARRAMLRHLESCAACKNQLAAFRALLPKTVLVDRPPPRFWQDYSRELRRKLDGVGTAPGRWRQWIDAAANWRAPAYATAAIVASVLTIALNVGNWRLADRPAPPKDALLEVLPLAENLELLQNLDLLEDLELLEIMGDLRDAAA